MSDNFGLRLRALIERKKLSIDGFADAFGIARSTAHNWLNRKSPPLEKHWKALSDYFGVSEQFIATGVAEIGLVGEADQVAYGSSDLLRAEARRFLEDALLAAGDDPSRLGWVREQLAAHLTPPKHWKANPHELALARDIAKDILAGVDLEVIARPAHESPPKMHGGAQR